MKMIELSDGQIIRADKYSIKFEIEKLKNSLKLIAKPNLNESDKRLNIEKINEQLLKLQNELQLFEASEKDKSMIKKFFIANNFGKQILHG